MSQNYWKIFFHECSGIDLIEVGLKKGKGMVVDISENYGRKVYSKHYSLDTTAYNKITKKYNQIYKRFFSMDKTTKILDIGCGYGNLIAALKIQGYSNVYGLDLSKDQALTTEKMSGCRCYNTSVQELPKEQYGTYGLIFCNHVLEHIENGQIESFLRVVSRLLKPTGTLVITVPNAMSPWAGYSMWHDFTHKRLYTPDSLSVHLEDAGFKIVDYDREGAVAYDMISSIRFILAQIHEAWLKFKFMVDIGPGRFKKNTIIVSPGLIAVAVKEGEKV